MFDTDAALEKAKSAVVKHPTLVAAVTGAGYYGSEIMYGWGNTIGP